MSQVSRELTHYAMKLLIEQGRKAEQYLETVAEWNRDPNPTTARPTLPSCSGIFRTMYDLPCSHEFIEELADNGGNASKLQYGRHWALRTAEEFEKWAVDGRQEYLDYLTARPVDEDAPNPIAILNPYTQFQRTSLRNISGPMIHSGPLNRRSQPAGSNSSRRKPGPKPRARTTPSTTSTGRIRSQHEVVARAEDPKAHRRPRTCGACQMPGHDRRNCPMLEQQEDDAEDALKAAQEAGEDAEGAFDE